MEAKHGFPKNKSSSYDENYVWNETDRKDTNELMQMLGVTVLNERMNGKSGSCKMVGNILQREDDIESIGF